MAEESKDTTSSEMWQNLNYQAGFGNHNETEAEKGALIKGKNNPQKAPMGLYAE